ncbi:MAG: GFA family protein [Iodobacter sp.]
MAERTGHCLCGAVSFKLSSDPLFTRICWCRDCQHLAANGNVVMRVSVDELTISGILAEYTKTADSGNILTRQFCPRCGTHLFGKLSAHPQVRIVRVGNLDDPSSVRPGMNIWAASAPNWACFDPALERAEQQPVPKTGT